MSKKIIYIDLDQTLCDFRQGVVDIRDKNMNPYDVEMGPPEMYQKGFFQNLKWMPGAEEALRTLQQNPNLDIYIATKPITRPDGLHCATEKYEWVRQNCPELLQKVFLTCDKGHLNGDYLIDDDKEQWEKKFKGVFIHFNEFHPERSWREILRYFKRYEN